MKLTRWERLTDGGTDQDNQELKHSFRHKGVTKRECESREPTHFALIFQEPFLPSFQLQFSSLHFNPTSFLDSFHSPSSCIKSSKQPLYFSVDKQGVTCQCRKEGKRRKAMLDKKVLFTCRVVKVIGSHNHLSVYCLL